MFKISSHPPINLNEILPILSNEEMDRMQHGEFIVSFVKIENGVNMGQVTWVCAKQLSQDIMRLKCQLEDLANEIYGLGFKNGYNISQKCIDSLKSKIEEK